MTDKAITCPGVLDQDTGRELFATVRSAGVGKGGVVLDMAGTTSLDSRGSAWVLKIAQWVMEHDGELRIENHTGRVAEFVEMLTPALRHRAKRVIHDPGILEEIGDRTYKYTCEWRQFGALLVDTIYWTFLAPFEGRGFRWGMFIDELHEMGVRAVRINFLMNFLLGLIIAMLSAAQLEQFGAVIYVADLLVIAFTRELAAIMTAVVVSARTGAAIAAELATMKVQDEIDALRGMGLNVTQFLVAPKVVALLVVMPCLVAIGMVAGILGGSVWGVVVMDIDATAWWNETLLAGGLDDVFQGFMKTFFFAITIVLVGCHNGLRVEGGSRGVGLMTTRSVVMDIFFIVIIDMAFAMVFYYVL